MVDWSEGLSTPRKYKPIFFVRYNAVEALPVLREKQQGFLVGRVSAMVFDGTSSAQSQLKIPEEVVFASEEAEALPAESDCPERKSTCSYFTVYIRRLKAKNLREEPLR